MGQGQGEDEDGVLKLSGRMQEILTAPALPADWNFCPTLVEVEGADECEAGFCRACGKWVGGVEPDAQEYECPGCDQFAVFGAAEFALRGWIK